LLAVLRYRRAASTCAGVVTTWHAVCDAVSAGTIALVLHRSLGVASRSWPARL